VLNVLAQRLAKTYPKYYPDKFDVQLPTIIDNVVGQFRSTLYTLLAAYDKSMRLAMTVGYRVGSRACRSIDGSRGCCFCFRHFRRHARSTVNQSCSPPRRG
jgi:hypothetical protein